jgi:hypothetical protein
MVVKDALIGYYRRGQGIELRDHFAGIAMYWYLNNYGSEDDMAKVAYELADKMLKAREAE